MLVALPALRSSKLDPFQQQRQLRRVELHMRRRRVCGTRKLERAGLKAFLHDAEAVAIPEHHLRDVTSTVEKHEQVAAQRLEPELRFDQRRKPVEALACVHRLRRHVDFHARRQRQHRAPPSATSRTLASTVASTAPVTRTRRPLPSTTSSSPLEGDLSRTRSVRPARTGTNLGVAPPAPRAGLASRRRRLHHACSVPACRPRASAYSVALCPLVRQASTSSTHAALALRGRRFEPALNSVFRMAPA